jgi:ring-1,2-phenylacetyl-CoA epoxidase subunit PaaC
LEGLAGGSWAPLADLVGKLMREERYHRMHIGAWLDRLARNDGEARSRLLVALRELAPDAATVFTPLSDEPTLIEAGVLAAPMVELERRWRDTIAPVMSSLDLPMPPPATQPARGRLDHGDAFRWLWGEFNAVRRTEPGVTW